MSVEDRWGGARTGTGARWEVRWREAGRQRKRRFASRTAALTFDARRRIDPNVAEHRAQLTVGQLVQTYLAGIGGLRPKTQDAYRYDADQVLAAFGDRLAVGLRPSEVRAWSARSGVSSAVRHRSMMMLRRCYRLAIADRALTVDPTEGVPMPKLRHAEQRFLTWEQLGRLAEACGEYAPLIALLGTTGLRLGEALGLDGAYVDRVRRRIHVRRSWSVSSRGAELGPTKGAKARDVPVSPHVLALLPVTDGPLFTGPKGGRLDPHSWRARVFRPAALAAGLGDMHPHELRHTAASLAIAAGADAGDVQRMLGQASAAVMWDRYRHLFDAHLDDVADAMEAAHRAHLGRIAPAEGADMALAAHYSASLCVTPEGSEMITIPALTRGNTT